MADFLSLTDKSVENYDSIKQQYSLVTLGPMICD